METVANKFGLYHLKPINVDTFPAEAFQRLWERVRGADYAFEDLTRGNIQWFATAMMQAGTYNFEVPDVAFVQLTGAGPGLNANVHFIPYTKVATGTLMDTARELFAFAFGTLEVHRLQAWVPVFNGRAIRLAALMHMKFEGELRRAFRYENEWWNVALYALTEDEWRESNASGRNQHTN